MRQFRLEAEVGCILGDGDALYAWCHAKNSYDKWKGALYGKITSKVNNSISRETTNT